MKKIFVVLLAGLSAFAFAQSREDVKINIPMPTGGSTEQQQFFLENFIMETTAAGYSITETKSASDYYIALEIKPNMVLYQDEDGSLVEEPAPEEDKQFLLALHLMRTNDETEIVYFEYPFTEKEEMYEFNLYLLYQAMANVPMTKLTDILEYDHWRNKWLYIRASIDYSVIAYQIDANKPMGQKDVYGIFGARGNQIGTVYEEYRQAVHTTPGGTIGAELQFLNWMSVEGNFRLGFGDISGSTFVPSLGLQVKFPLKPAKHFMLEPYAAVNFPMNTSPTIRKFDPVEVGGGFQFGVKGGDMGAVFVDVNFFYHLGEIHIVETDDMARNAFWTRWLISFGIGYKIGFFNRNKADVK